MKRMLLSVLVASSAFADEATWLFESQEDASTPPDAAVCAAAGFTTNVQLGASLWSVKTSRHDGRVVEQRRRIGRATACLQLTNVMFPEGLVQKFFAQFELPQGTYTATGTCTVSSNSVPQPFIILAGCTLKLSGGPPGSLGGIMTSASVFNPLHRPGFSTGSSWTLHEYWDAALRRPRHDHDHDEDDE